MKARTVRVWWHETLGCWCFRALDARGGHIVSARVYWDGLYSGRLWSSTATASDVDIEQDARQAFGAHAHDYSIIVEQVDP